MSFGIGAFPFGFFASNFNFGEERPGAPIPGSHQAIEEAFLHKIFLWVSDRTRPAGYYDVILTIFRLLLRLFSGCLSPRRCY